MKIYGALTLLLFGVLATASCQNSQSHDPEESLPTHSWKQTTPNQQSIDEAVLKELHGKFGRGEYGYVDGMLLIRNGEIVYETSYQNDYESLNLKRDPSSGLPVRYYDSTLFPYFKETGLHTLQSVTKSVTASVVGVALERGDLQAIDIPIQGFFPEESDLFADERKRAVTLEHLLTMTMGNDWDESISYMDPLNPAVAMEKSDDWVRFVLERKMIHQPGAVFSYSSGTSQLISVIIQNVTGLKVSDYAAKHLFSPLGITDYHWAETPQGLTDTEGGLYLKPRDLAKIGLLHLHGGVWDGKRILAEGWAERSTQPIIDTGRLADRGSPERGNIAYGHQWWLLPFEIEDRQAHAVTANGFGGQRLYVLRELNLIAVFTGWNIYDHPSLPSEVMYKYVLESVIR